MNLLTMARPARIGIVVALACTLPFSFVLEYAGFGFAGRVAYLIGAPDSGLVRAGAYFLWVVVAIGVPGTLGYLAGSGVQRMREQRRGA